MAGWKKMKISVSPVYEQQRRWIRQATDAVEKAAGIRPVVFRAPNLWIGETTLRALEHEGYRYDSSVPARRFDMGLGRVHYPNISGPRGTLIGHRGDNLRSSRRKSHPGSSPILCLFPINLATLRTLGLPVFQRMIRGSAAVRAILYFIVIPLNSSRGKSSVSTSMSKWNQKGM